MKKYFVKSPQNPSHLWIWGTHACLAALQNPKRHCYRLLLTKTAEKEFSTFPQGEIVEGHILSRWLPEGAVHQGVAMEVAPLSEPSFSRLKGTEKGVLVVLDHVTDPHNVGSILRTARALKALGVGMTERNTPPLAGALAKTASGALEHLPVWKVTNLARSLEELKSFGFWTIGLDERAPQVLTHSTLPDRVAIVLGAEGEGLRRLTQEKCDFLVRLPTDPEFPTLNVSVAGALALYELIRPC